MIHPPFCPNSDCLNYHDPSTKTRWYVKNGTYPNHRSGKAQRFKCKTCGTGFSTETFSIDYCVKLKVPYKTIMEHLYTSSGIRDISRLLKISCSTVTNRIARFSRQAMAIQDNLTATLNLKEDLVADGFESFTYSQYFPNNIQILVGKESQFWTVADYAHLNRKGRMTKTQKKKNEIIKKQANINRVTIYQSFTTLVQTVLDLQSRSDRKTITLYTDEHTQYKKVMDTLSPAEKEIIKHTCINSKKVRTYYNPLFSVNFIDRELRKDCANHVRETLQWAKNVANAMDRIFLYRLYHNFIKPYRINGSSNNHETHATKAGISEVDIRKELKTLFTQRRFLGREKNLNFSERKVWCRCIHTPKSSHADYLPRYALA